MDYDTEKEYIAALERQDMEDEEFGFGHGMAPPNARWLGGGGYAPEGWREARKPKDDNKSGNSGGSGSRGTNVPAGEYWY